MGETMRGKEYLEPTGLNWWLKKRNYKLYILRELTAVFVAGYAIFLLALLFQAQRGPYVLSRFLEGLKSPLSIALHLVVLAMTIYHSITWFNSLPKARVFWRGEERVSPALIVAPQYIVWVVVSVAVAWIAVLFSRG
jgi:fumarate reductase subunit C